MGILASTELLMQAKNYSGSGDWLDETGNGHDAQFGSTAGADTNDPQVLAYDADQYVYLSGTSGNKITTPGRNLLGCDSSWFAQGTGGLWTVGTPSTDFALGASSRSLKVSGGVSTAITPGTDAAVFSLYVYSVAGDTFDINGSAGTAVSAGTWTQLTEAGPDGTYTVSAVGAGDYYLAQVQVAANAVFVPSIRVDGDLDVRMSAKLANWTTSAKSLFGLIWLQNSSGVRVYLNGANPLFQFVVSGGSTVTRVWPNTVAALVNGQRHELRFTRESATDVFKAYADDVLLDTTDGADDGTVIMDNSAGDPLIRLGSAEYANWLDGEVYWWEVRDGLDGPVCTKFDANDLAEPFATAQDGQGHVWTINRSGSGTYVIDQPAFGVHTDDYFEIPTAAGLNFDWNESFTVMVLARTGVDDTSTDILLAKKSDVANGAGYMLVANGWNGKNLMKVSWGTGSGEVSSVATPAVGTRFTATGVKDGAADTIEAYTDGVSGGSVNDPTTATHANTLPIRIGTLSASTGNAFNGEIMAIAVWRQALTAAEIVEAKEALEGVSQDYQDEPIGRIGQLIYT